MTIVVDVPTAHTRVLTRCLAGKRQRHSHPHGALVTTSGTVVTTAALAPHKTNRVRLGHTVAQAADRRSAGIVEGKIPAARETFQEARVRQTQRPADHSATGLGTIDRRCVGVSGSAAVVHHRKGAHSACRNVQVIRSWRCDRKLQCVVRVQADRSCGRGFCVGTNDGLVARSEPGRTAAENPHLVAPLASRGWVLQ